MEEWELGNFCFPDYFEMRLPSSVLHYMQAFSCVSLRATTKYYYFRGKK